MVDVVNAGGVRGVPLLWGSGRGLAVSGNALVCSLQLELAEADKSNFDHFA